MKTLLKLWLALSAISVLIVWPCLVIAGRADRRMAALLMLALLCGGCATAPLTHDTIPAGYEQVIQQGKQDALNWFPQRWGEPPKVVPFLCYIPEPTPREGGMWSTGHQVHFWVGQPNKRGSFDHEYRHHLNWNNGHGAGQGTQADEEATR